MAALKEKLILQMPIPKYNVTDQQGSIKIAKKEKAATDAACNCALLHEICALGWLPHLFRCPVKPAFAIEIRQKTRPDGPVT